MSSKPAAAHEWHTVALNWTKSTHVPTYYVIVRLWRLFAGNNPAILRLPSLFLFGLFTWGTAQYRTLLSKRQFRLFVPLLLMSPAAVYLASEARDYMLLMSCSQWLTVCALRFLRRHESGSKAALSVAIWAMLLATVDYFGLVYASTVLPYVMIETWRRRRTVPAILPATLILQFAVPLAWTLHAWTQLGKLTGGHAWLSFAPVSAMYGYFIFTFGQMPVLLLVAATGAMLRYRRFFCPEPVHLAVAVTVAGAAFTMLFSLHTPILSLRTFLVFLPPATLLTAAGIDAALYAAERRGWRFGMVAVSVLIAAMFADACWRNLRPIETWKETGLLLEQYGCAGKTILVGTNGRAEILYAYDYAIGRMFDRDGLKPPIFVDVDAPLPAGAESCRVKAVTIHLPVPPAVAENAVRRKFGTQTTHAVAIKNGYIIETP